MHRSAHWAFLSPPIGPGQRDLAVAAYRVMANGGRLFLAAPTGIGKTISVLFPAVKALGENKVERIFYLTARTVGRAIAEKALVDLRQSGLKLRSVTLTAKQKVCVAIRPTLRCSDLSIGAGLLRPNQACHPRGAGAGRNQSLGPRCRCTEASSLSVRTVLGRVGLGRCRNR